MSDKIENESVDEKAKEQVSDKSKTELNDDQLKDVVGGCRTGSKPTGALGYGV